MFPLLTVEMLKGCGPLPPVPPQSIWEGLGPEKPQHEPLALTVSTQLCNETCLGTAPLRLLMIWTSCSCHFLLNKLRCWRRVTASNYPGRRGEKKPARREFERLLVLCEGKIDYVHQMFFFNGCFIDEKLKWQASSSPNNTVTGQQNCFIIAVTARTSRRVESTNASLD